MAVDKISDAGFDRVLTLAYAFEENSKLDGSKVSWGELKFEIEKLSNNELEILLGLVINKKYFGIILSWWLTWGFSLIIGYLFNLPRLDSGWFSLVAKGASNTEIANTLYISEYTVKARMRNIKRTKDTQKAASGNH